MNQEKIDNQQNNQSNENEPTYETYGWEFHKGPLLYALILTVLFYAFIFFYINI